jgi:hypothetical protein
MPHDARGLSEQEAAARLAQEGPNEIPSLGRRSLRRIAADVLSEPMFVLSLGAAALFGFTAWLAHIFLPATVPHTHSVRS